MSTASNDTTAADEICTVKRSELVDAFDEWQRRYEEDPDSFTDADPDPDGYGEDCTAYLLGLVDEAREDA